MTSNSGIPLWGWPLVPFLVVYYGSQIIIQESYKEVKHRYLARSSRIKPLPRKRRQLSFYEPNDRNLEQCALFKLPYELRLQIYSYVLGGKLLHIVQVPKRLGHLQCPKTQLKHQRQYCCGIGSWPTKKIQQLCNADAAILRTCRAVYNEASGVLYGQNTFDFNRLHSLALFSIKLRENKFALITKLRVRCLYHSPRDHFDWQEATDPEFWNPAWGLIANHMPALRELDVLITLHDESFRQDHSEWWIQSVLAVRPKRRFHIEVRSLNTFANPHPELKKLGEYIQAEVEKNMKHDDEEIKDYKGRPSFAKFRNIYLQPA